ncbi:MAG: hypothetical protein RBS57_10815 [Desulforhabdus sp.]|jgi:hypothetical protein|nr:hypothetical protein [Desulforhabdus sp.]
MKKLGMIWIVFSLMFTIYGSALAEETLITDFSSWYINSQGDAIYDYTTKPGTIYLNVGVGLVYIGKIIPKVRGVKATINISEAYVPTRTGILQSVATLNGIRIKGYIYLDKQGDKNTIKWTVFYKYPDGSEGPVQGESTGVLGTWAPGFDSTISVVLVGNEIWFSDGLNTVRWQPPVNSTMTPIDSWTELFTHTWYGGQMYATVTEVYTIVPTIETLLIFFDQSVADARLIGDGKTPQASEGKLNASKNMILNAQDLIAAGNNTEACIQLADAYGKTDGQPNPPDTVIGAAAPGLATMIEDLRKNLQCP